MIIQAGHEAFAANDFNAALYWFELVHTWAPSSVRDEVEFCRVAGAALTLPVRLMPAVLHCLRLCAPT